MSATFQHLLCGALMALASAHRLNSINRVVHTAAHSDSVIQSDDGIQSNTAHLSQEQNRIFNSSLNEFLLENSFTESAEGTYELSTAAAATFAWRQEQLKQCDHDFQFCVLPGKHSEGKFSKEQSRYLHDQKRSVRESIQSEADAQRIRLFGNRSQTVMLQLRPQPTREQIQRANDMCEEMRRIGVKFVLMIDCSVCNFDLFARLSDWGEVF